MPFKEVNIKAEIEKRKNAGPAFKESWDNSRMEYAVLRELTRARKEKGLTQLELAEKTGAKQQVISRMENKEASPTLKTLCNVARALDLELKLVPKQQINEV
jgi:ribosome-binding protein aMBF1 (putative translation factor)